ncbi:hypothetical protein K469DRAFT_809211 [Zopfia rhizophila CBS 207.26]|uniref:Uncharacterized protein n=1 Tax=Zopfia rhizophila CBS 207.26 TaxID=1314779 RepID=A0A6A6EKD4_9PEZI|nr:hypothetical protein K469DRAFT_809211 [Zopfia rhizophila CBS 207.26]
MFLGRKMALLEAVDTRDVAFVQLLCDASADVNSPTTLGILRTSLQRTAKLGSYNIVQYLISRGANFNAEPSLSSGGTALQLATIKGYVGIAEFLLQEGANINAAPSKF